MSRISSFLFIAFLPLCFLLSPAISNAETHAGKTSFINLENRQYDTGNTSVLGNSGQYSISIPLDLLPARRNFIPDLNINYGLGQKAGYMGKGFGLAFHSFIERRSNKNGVPIFSNTDELYIDGRKLVQVSRGKFQTLQNDFTTYSRTDHGWAVKKNGLTRYYGEMPNSPSRSSEDECSGLNSIAYQMEYDERTPDRCAQKETRWYLSYVVDQFGNSIEYRYQKNAGIILPAQIIYNKQSDENYNIIEFSYISGRADPHISYYDGTKRYLNELLETITVHSVLQGTKRLAQKYSFEYTQHDGDNATLLNKIYRHSSKNENQKRLLRSFEYDREETSWATRETLNLDQPPVQPSWAQQRSDDDNTAHTQTFSMLSDINSDSRPDYLVFNTRCSFHSYDADDDRETAGDSLSIPSHIHVYECDSDHRVFINTIGADKAPEFQFEESLSTQLNSFFGPMRENGLNGKRQNFSIVDINNDGYTDLLKERDQKYVLGTEDGWLEENYQEAEWLRSLGGKKTLEYYQFADLNGDALLDLVGQNQYILNSGQSPYFEASSIQILSDPLVGDGTAPYGSASDSCMRSDDARRVLFQSTAKLERARSTSNIYDWGESITPEEWVWRNTLHADFNGDGILDRAIIVKWLEKNEVSYDIPFNPMPARKEVWKNSSNCDFHDRIYLGNGRGGFEDAGYGTGGPMTRDSARSQISTGSDTAAIYEYPINHFSVVDIDRSGRAEILQYCDDELKAIKYDGAVLGYNTQDAGSCSSHSVGSIPIKYSGSDPIDAIYSGLIDLNGDGMADGFKAHDPLSSYVDVNGQRVFQGAALPSWYANKRLVAKNRLLSVTNEIGVKTSYEWGWSAQQPNKLPMNLDVVSSVQSKSGKTSFTFSQGAFGDRQFLGFGQTEIDTPSGATVISRYNQSLALFGTLRTEEVYDQGKNLKKITANVHQPQTETMQRRLRAVNPSVIDIETVFRRPDPSRIPVLQRTYGETFYQPLSRSCIFEFGQKSSGRFLPNIDDYQNICDTFVEEAQVNHCPNLENCTIKAPLTSLENLPWVSQADNERSSRKNWALARGLLSHDLTKYKTSRATMETEAETSGRSVLRTSHSVDSFYIPAGKIDWQKYDVITDMLRREWEKPPAFRVYVTEFEHDLDKGLLKTIRDLKDITRIDDSKITQFTYNDYDSEYGGYYLSTEATSDYLGNRLARTEFDNYQGDAWGTKKETHSGEQRQKSRQLNAYGELIKESHWQGTNETHYSYDHCGQTKKQEQLNGQIWTSYSRDEKCRITAKESFTGHKEVFEYDGYDRVVSHKKFLKTNEDQTKEIASIVLYNDNPETLGQKPVKLTVEFPGIGDRHVANKVYIDAFGREEKHITCDVKGRPSSVDPKCLDDDPDRLPAKIIKSYYSNNGRLKAVTKPHALMNVSPAQKIFEYDEFGRTLSETNEDGRKTSYSYGFLGQNIELPSGRKISYKQDTVLKEKRMVDAFIAAERNDAFGRVTARYNADYKAVEYTYDAFGNLVAEKSSPVNVLNSCNSGTTWEQAEIKRDYDLAGRIIRETDALGNHTKKTYDILNRVTSITGPDGQTLQKYNYSDRPFPENKKIVTDQFGATQTSWFDTAGDAYKTQDKDGSFTHLVKDDQGRSTETKLPWGEIKRVGKYDLFGVPVQTHQIMGDVVSTTTMRPVTPYGQTTAVINSDGDYIFKQFSHGQLAEKQYIGRNKQYLVSNYEYNLDGQVMLKNSKGLKTKYFYDDQGRLEQTLDGYNSADQSWLRLQKLDYNDLGQIIAETNGLDETARYEYDDAGRQINNEVFATNGETLGQQRQWFNLNGNLIKTTDAAGVKTCYEYDAYGRQISMQHAGRGAARTEYIVNPVNPLTNQVFKGLLTKSTSATGDISETYTDPKGQTIYTKSSDGQLIENRYENGLAVMVVKYGKGQNPVSKRVTLYYPESNRIKFQSGWLNYNADISNCSAADNVECSGTSYSYTSSGKIKTIQDQQGNERRYTYKDDGSGLLKSLDIVGQGTLLYRYDETYPVKTGFRQIAGDNWIDTQIEYEQYLTIANVEKSSNDNQFERTDFEYDLAGNQIRTTLQASHQPTVVTAKKFDALGRVLLKEIQIENELFGQLKKSYNDRYRLDTITYPSGHQVKYNYIAQQNALASIQLISAQNGATTDIIRYDDYDDGGRLLDYTIEGENSLRIKREFDDAGIEKQRHLRYISEERDRFIEYEYDALGRLNEIKMNGDINTVKNYGFDHHGFLVSEKYKLDEAKSIFNYDYSPSGLRLKTTHKADGQEVFEEEYAYNTGYRMSQINDRELDWDGFGRLLRDAKDNGFKWGLSNQLIEITSRENQIIKTIYDPDNQRLISKQEGTESFYFPSDTAGQVFHFKQKDISGEEVMHDFVYAPGGQLIASLDKEGRIEPIYLDKKGTVTQKTGSNDLFYTAYGMPMNAEDTETGHRDETSPVFHSMWQTGVENLYMAGHRVYNAEMGLFLSPDPLDLNSSDHSMSTNPYLYGLNNPVHYSDSTGLSPIGVVNGVVMDGWMYGGFQAPDPSQSYASHLMNQYQSSAGVSFVYGSIPSWGMSGVMDWDPDEGWFFYDPSSGMGRNDTLNFLASQAASTSPTASRSHKSGGAKKRGKGSNKAAISEALSKSDPTVKEATDEAMEKCHTPMLCAEGMQSSPLQLSDYYAPQISFDIPYGEAPQEEANSLKEILLTAFVSSRQGLLLHILVNAAGENDAGAGFVDGLSFSTTRLMRDIAYPDYSANIDYAGNHYYYGSWAGEGAQIAITAGYGGAVSGSLRAVPRIAGAELASEGFMYSLMYTPEAHAGVGSNFLESITRRSVNAVAPPSMSTRLSSAGNELIRIPMRDRNGRIVNRWVRSSMPVRIRTGGQPPQLSAGKIYEKAILGFLRRHMRVESVRLFAGRRIPDARLFDGTSSTLLEIKLHNSRYLGTRQHWYDSEHERLTGEGTWLWRAHYIEVD